MAEKHSVLVFLDSLRNSARPSKAPGTVVDVFEVADNPGSFVCNQLEELRESGQGIFSRLKHRKGDVSEPYFEYQCERHNKPRGKSSGVSTETRANRCTAFVSFKFVNDGEHSGCIRRLRSRHNGHDPSSMEEKCVSMIDKNLIRVIEALAFNGKRAKDILQAIKVWSVERGYRNTSDRRYYPRAQDVHNILKAYRKHLQFHKDDILCVEQLLLGALHHSCLYAHLPTSRYPSPDCTPSCPLQDDARQTAVLCDTAQSPQFRATSSANVAMPCDGDWWHGLCIVLQSPEQAEYLQSHCSECQFAYFTICGRELVNNNGKNSEFLVCILGVPDKGYTVPVASVIAEETTECLMSALQVLKERCPDFSPRAFIVDQNDALSGSLQQEWPETVQLWSWYQVLQSLVTDMGSNFKSGLSGPKNIDTQQAIIRCMWQLRNCSKESHFEKLSASLMTRLGKKGQAYLQTHWLSSGRQWSHFGCAPIFQDGPGRQDKLAEMDRLFVKQKLMFSTCQLNQKLDCILLMLMQTIGHFFACLSAGTAICEPRTAQSDIVSTSQSITNNLDSGLDGTESFGSSMDSRLHGINQSATTNVDCSPCTTGSSLVYIASSCDVKLHNEKLAAVSHDHVKARVKLEIRTVKEEGGLLSRAVWLEDGVCIVPSEVDVLLSWKVDFVMGLCSCPAAIIEGTCRHLQVDPTAKCHHLSPPLQDLRRRAADEIIKRQTFHQFGETFLVLHTGCYLSSFVVVKDSIMKCMCSCWQTGGGLSCVCKMVVAALSPDKNLIFGENSKHVMSGESSKNLMCGDSSNVVTCRVDYRELCAEDGHIVNQESVAESEHEPLKSVSLDYDGVEISEHDDSEEVIEEIVLTAEHHQADFSGEIVVVDMNPLVHASTSAVYSTGDSMHRGVNGMSAGSLSELLLSLSAAGDNVVVAEDASAVIPKHKSAAAPINTSEASMTSQPTMAPTSWKVLPSSTLTVHEASSVESSASHLFDPDCASFKSEEVKLANCKSDGCKAKELNLAQCWSDGCTKDLIFPHTNPQSSGTNFLTCKKMQQCVSPDGHATLGELTILRSVDPENESISLNSQSPVILSTRQMILDLAKWADSEHFEDRAELKDFISKAYTQAISISKSAEGNNVEVSSTNPLVHAATGTIKSTGGCMHMGVKTNSSVSRATANQTHANAQSTQPLSASATKTCTVETYVSDSCDKRSSNITTHRQLSVKSSQYSSPTHLITEKGSPSQSENSTSLTHLNKLIVSRTVNSSQSSPIVIQQISASPAQSPSSTQTAKRCLDDLVRRLEMRQQGEESMISCVPSPAKRSRNGASESGGDDTNISYLLPARQEGDAGEVIYIVTM